MARRWRVAILRPTSVLPAPGTPVRNTIALKASRCASAMILCGGGTWGWRASAAVATTGRDMIPEEVMGTARVPGQGGELRCYRHDGDFTFRIGRLELMSSRVHGSEE